jgi:hypothetical protein
MDTPNQLIFSSGGESISIHTDSLKNLDNWFISEFEYVLSAIEEKRIHNLQDLIEVLNERLFMEKDMFNNELYIGCDINPETLLSYKISELNLCPVPKLESGSYEETFILQPNEIEKDLKKFIFFSASFAILELKYDDKNYITEPSIFSYSVLKGHRNIYFAPERNIIDNVKSYVNFHTTLREFIEICRNEVRKELLNLEEKNYFSCVICFRNLFLFYRSPKTELFLFYQNTDGIIRLEYPKTFIENGFEVFMIERPVNGDKLVGIILVYKINEVSKSHIVSEIGSKQFKFQKCRTVIRHRDFQAMVVNFRQHTWYVDHITMLNKFEGTEHSDFVNELSEILRKKMFLKGFRMKKDLLLHSEMMKTNQETRITLDENKGIVLFEKETGIYKFDKRKNKTLADFALGFPFRIIGVCELFDILNRSRFAKKAFYYLNGFDANLELRAKKMTKIVSMIVKDSERTFESNKYNFFANSQRKITPALVVKYPENKQDIKEVWIYMTKIVTFSIVFEGFKKTPDLITILLQQGSGISGVSIKDTNTDAEVKVEDTQYVHLIFCGNVEINENTEIKTYILPLGGGDKEHYDRMLFKREDVEKDFSEYVRRVGTHSETRYRILENVYKDLKYKVFREFETAEQFIRAKQVNKIPFTAYIKAFLENKNSYKDFMKNRIEERKKNFKTIENETEKILYEKISYKMEEGELEGYENECKYKRDKNRKRYDYEETKHEHERGEDKYERDLQRDQEYRRTEYEINRGHEYEKRPYEHERDYEHERRHYEHGARDYEHGARDYEYERRDFENERRDFEHERRDYGHRERHDDYGRVHEKTYYHHERRYNEPERIHEHQGCKNRKERDEIYARYRHEKHEDSKRSETTTVTKKRKYNEYYEKQQDSFYYVNYGPLYYYPVFYSPSFAGFLNPYYHQIPQFYGYPEKERESKRRRI